MHAPGQTTGGPYAPYTVTVHRMSASDLSAVLAILKESLEASMWSGESLLESASHGIAFAAKLNGTVAGFLVGRVVADEFEILNMAVARDFRRLRVATKLVTSALEYARSAGARKTYLEVRASNEGGIGFYERMGFQDVGRRPNYYSEPTEDAVLLVLRISAISP